MKLELGKLYEARDGSVWRVVCVDNVGSQPVVAVNMKGGAASRFCLDGGYLLAGVTGHEFDITREHVPAPELVAHYPAVIEKRRLSQCLYSSFDDAARMCGTPDVRLATEYPAIMLPRKEPR